MHSIFSNKNILPHLSRRSRTRTRRDVTSPSKAKPLDILPGVTEEDETRWSTSSASSSSSATTPATQSSTVGRTSSDIKRDSRRVVLTGAEGLTFDDFFPISNAPRSATAPSKIESPLNEINLRFSGLGFTMDFPSPPLASSSSRRDKSPTPSESSTHTSASGSSTSSSKSSSTPPTSDDESSKPRLSRSATLKSQRASVMFMKSTSPSEDVSFTPEMDEDEGSDGEDAAWFTEDISDIITLSSPLPPSFPSTPTSATSDPRARPDSLPPPPRCEHIGRSRFSKPLPILPRISVQPSGYPSSQLDPSFVSKYRRYIPTRPPPPPPIRINGCPSPTMEEKTDELLELLANAALGTGFLGTGLRQVPEPVSTPVTPSSIFAMSVPDSARPPPRSAIPDDISDIMDFEGADDDASTASIVDLSYYSESSSSAGGIPMTPESMSIYSQASARGAGFPASPLSSFDFEMAETPTPTSGAMHFSSLPTLPESPNADADAGMYSSPRTPPPPTPSERNHEINERILRSRWSSSTLSSLDQAVPPSASSWMLRFHLGGSGSSSASPKHAKKPSGFKAPLSPVAGAKRSLDMGSPLMRRESMESRLSIDSSSDSGCSTSSNGLRRKAIPVELFMR
ncbi:hypothetical protein EIP91_000497 [Steccherinum ochraceum]|uniref:Uncharacterized protein n=1 Tax=Steccherinum ochraceum TaxID=92696 RepID=A0A4R0RXY0_9APHY|nr:hypothetical protein EIP91_000497 [Steccherinum ochraceum]